MFLDEILHELEVMTVNREIYFLTVGPISLRFLILSTESRTKSAVASANVVNIFGVRQQLYTSIYKPLYSALKLLLFY